MTTASIDVPLAGRPSAHCRPASPRTRDFTSVTVSARFTSAAGSGLASSTTIVLIVPTGAAAAALQPAAIRLPSPTVTTTSASMSAARSEAT